MFIATSLDGFIGHKDGDAEWLTNPPRNDQHCAPSVNHSAASECEQDLASVDHIILERKTFGTASSFIRWPYPNYKLLVLSRGTSIADPVSLL